jgi:hypothetical protein
MSTFLRQARLIETLLELGDADAALRVARMHADDLSAALRAAPADPDAVREAAACDRSVQTPRRRAVVPTFTIAVAGAVEGRVVVGATVRGESAEDERRVWRFALDHPVVGGPLRELLTSAAWTPELEQQLGEAEL